MSLPWTETIGLASSLVSDGGAGVESDAELWFAGAAASSGDATEETGAGAVGAAGAVPRS